MEVEVEVQVDVSVEVHVEVDVQVELEVEVEAEVEEGAEVELAAEGDVEVKVDVKICARGPWVPPRFVFHRSLKSDLVEFRWLLTFTFERYFKVWEQQKQMQREKHTGSCP